MWIIVPCFKAQIIRKKLLLRRAVYYPPEEVFKGMF